MTRRFVIRLTTAKVRMRYIKVLDTTMYGWRWGFAGQATVLSLVDAVLVLNRVGVVNGSELVEVDPSRWAWWTRNSATRP